VSYILPNRRLFKFQPGHIKDIFYITAYDMAMCEQFLLMYSFDVIYTDRAAMNKEII